MLCIHNTQTDPYFNLAAEEYLLKNFKENIFMLWQNEPSIVIGKHQDVWAEVNLKFVQDQQIKIARRFSGGGAVYHDPGNLNLTFIETGQIMQGAGLSRLLGLVNLSNTLLYCSLVQLRIAKVKSLSLSVLYST